MPRFYYSKGLLLFAVQRVYIINTNLKSYEKIIITAAFY
jgi:hypothetical protein